MIADRMRMVREEIINYVAVGSNSSPRCRVYLIEDETISTADSYTLPSYGWAAAFSYAGDYLGMGHEGSPYFTLLHFDKKTGNLTLADTYNVGAWGRGVAFSSTGEYIAVTSSGSPYFRLLYNDNGTLSLADTYSLPSTGLRVSFSPDDKYIVIAHGAGSGTANVTLLNHSNGTVSKADDYTCPAGTLGIAFSPTGQYIAVGYGTSPYFSILENNGGTLSKKSDCNIASRADDIAFSNNGWIAVGNNSDRVTLLSFDSGIATVADTATASNYVRGIAISPKGDYMFAADDYSNGRLFRNSSGTLTQVDSVSLASCGRAAAWNPVPFPGVGG